MGGGGGGEEQAYFPRKLSEPDYLNIPVGLHLKRCDSPSLISSNDAFNSSVSVHDKQDDNRRRTKIHP
jgi:hypothetical protein